MRYRVKHTLKVWRNIAGLTQNQLAEKLRESGLDTTQSTISMCETGVTQPNAVAIAELEKVLKIKWSDDIIMP